MGCFSSDSAVPTPVEPPKFRGKTKSERNINEVEINMQERHSKDCNI